MSPVKNFAKFNFFKKSMRQLGIVITLLVMCIIFMTLTSAFVTQRNITNILLQTSINGIIAIGMTLVIITGGIDLSVGSVVAISSMTAAKLMVGGYPILLVILISLIVGIVCGVINGALISIIDLQPFLVTLGTMSLFRGLTLIYSNGLPVRNLPSSFLDFMNSLNKSVPIPVIIMFVFAVGIAFIIRYFKYGQYVFATGGNQEATRLAGVNVKATKIVTYGISGLACAIAGIIYLGRLAAADPQAGSGYELDAIAAAAVGGASLAGGKGSILGTIIGALLLGTLKNGLTLLNVQAFYQQVAIGLIIIIAITIDRYSNKK